MQRPTRVTADTDGRLWIADPGAGCVQVLDPRGAPHATIADPLARPAGIALTAAADAGYVADPGLGAVVRIAPDSSPDVIFRLDGVVDVALDQARDLVYAACTDGPIRRLHLSTRRSEIVTDRSAAGLALSPDRTRLYGICPRTLSVFVVTVDDDRVEEVVAGPEPTPPRSVAADVTLGPGGIVVVDAHTASLRGINIRHGTTTVIQRDPLVAPTGVTFSRARRAYVVAEPDSGRLVTVAADGSGAALLSA